MKAYLHWLKLFSKKYQVGIHSWVLMTNHVHLLCINVKKGASSLSENTAKLLFLTIALTNNQ